LVQDLIMDLGAAHGFDSVELVEVKEEDVRFSLPAALAPFASRLVSISA
jgi:hypothetical protein